MCVGRIGWRLSNPNVVMWKLIITSLFMVAVNGCVCQQCCQYLMAPSTVYVQMNPSAYGIIAPPTDASATMHTSTTNADHIFANHLQWVIMTDKPWTRGNDIYYAVSAQNTQHHSGSSNINQPTLYFMPNWWNKIQEAAGVPETSQFAMQLNEVPTFPSEAPQGGYHSFPPETLDNVGAIHTDTNAQPAATITVLNEQPDLLPQSAKAAQELLQEIQQQLQKLNQRDPSNGPTKHIDTPFTHENSNNTQPVEPVTRGSTKESIKGLARESGTPPSTTRSPIRGPDARTTVGTLTEDEDFTEDEDLTEERNTTKESKARKKEGDDEPPARSRFLGVEEEQKPPRRWPTSKHSESYEVQNFSIKHVPILFTLLVTQLLLFIQRLPNVYSN